MDDATARLLNQLTCEFYAENAKSFEQTRRNSWPGWERMLRETGLAACSPGHAVRVFDVACGSCRFERWLSGRLPGVRLECRAVDSSEELMRLGAPFPMSDARMAFRRLDVTESLLAGNVRAGLRAGGFADAAARSPRESGCFVSGAYSTHRLTVCFGFFHHVPGEQNRRHLLQALVDCAEAGEWVVVSLWRFMESPSLAAQAVASHESALPQARHAWGLDPAQLEPDDFLLGWQGVQGTCRYCHHFGEDEVDRLVSSVGDAAELVSRFKADGRTGALNEYLVLRKRA